MTSRIAVLAFILAIAGSTPKAQAGPADKLEGWAHFFGMPTVTDWTASYPEVLARPNVVTRQWFEAEMDRINSASSGFVQARDYIADAARLTGTVLRRPEIGKIAGSAVEILAEGRDEVFLQKRASLLRMYAVAGSLTGKRPPEVKAYLLSAAVTKDMPAKDKAAWREAVNRLMEGWQGAEFDELVAQIQKQGALAIDTKKETAEIAKMMKTQAAQTAELKKLLDSLEEAQKELAAAQRTKEPKKSAAAMHRIYSVSSDLAQLSDAAGKAFQLAGNTTLAKRADQATLVFTTIANTAGNLPHNPLGAAVALLGGMTGLFGRGDTWKRDVMDALSAIRQDLFEQRKLLLEISESLRVMSAGQLVTQHTIAVNARIQHQWFKKIDLGLEALGALLRADQLKLLLRCEQWAVRGISADRAFVKAMDECALELTTVQQAVDQARGDLNLLSPYFLALPSGGDATTSSPSTTAALEIVGIQAVYREMAWACWTSAGCQRRMQAELPAPVWAKHSADFYAVPLLDPQVVNAVARGASAWFDFHIACRKPADSALALAAFSGSDYLGSGKPDLPALCKTYAPKQKDFIPRLEAAAFLVRIAKVQAAIMSGEYLAPDVVTELRSVSGTLKLGVANACSVSTTSPAAEIAQACEQRGASNCSVIKDLEEGKQLLTASIESLNDVLLLSGARLCGTATGSRLTCLLNLNPMFAANVGLGWARSYVDQRGGSPWDRTRQYTMAHADPLSCENLWNAVGGGGVLDGTMDDISKYVASSGWTTRQPISSTLEVLHAGALACRLQNSGPAGRARWSLATYEVSPTGYCTSAKIPLPEPAVVAAGLDSFRSAAAVRVGQSAARLQHRLVVLDPPMAGVAESFNEQRWLLYGRLSLIQAAALSQR